MSDALVGICIANFTVPDTLLLLCPFEHRIPAADSPFALCLVMEWRQCGVWSPTSIKSYMERLGYSPGCNDSPLMAGEVHCSLVVGSIEF